MTKYIAAIAASIVIIITVSIYPPTEVYAFNPPLPDDEEPAPTKRELQALSDYYADKYGVERALLRSVIACESNWVPDVQSNHHYQFNDALRGIQWGERERSFGLAQISAPHHPNVSYEQAIDPDFALDFAARHISEGRGYWWTCYRMLE